MPHDEFIPQDAEAEEFAAQQAEAEEFPAPQTEMEEISVPQAGVEELPGMGVEAAEFEAAVADPYARPHEPHEDAPMLDVHPPHEGIHSWKQYLLHMSTIVLGLLIAIGLEQSVEALHRAHERSELRDALDRDTRLAIDNARSSEEAEMVSLHWHNARVSLLGDALTTHRALTAPLERTPHVTSVQPADPAWEAAKSSGLLSLLTQDEVEVYSQADALIVAAHSAFDDGVAAARKRGQFEFQYADPKTNMMDLSKATPAELAQYRDLLLDEGTAWNQYRIVCEYIRGAETAIHEGERDIEKVQAANQRFYQPVVR